MPNVVINTHSHIGISVILNSAAVIEHENDISDFVHISPNCSLGGNVLVKKNTHIGIGSISDYHKFRKSAIRNCDAWVVKHDSRCWPSRIR